MRPSARAHIHAVVIAGAVTLPPRSAPDVLDPLRAALCRTDWMVCARASFLGAEQVYAYLRRMDERPFSSPYAGAASRAGERVGRGARRTSGPVALPRDARPQRKCSTASLHRHEYRRGCAMAHPGHDPPERTRQQGGPTDDARHVARNERGAVPIVEGRGRGITVQRRCRTERIALTLRLGGNNEEYARCHDAREACATQYPRTRDRGPRGTSRSRHRGARGLGRPQVRGLPPGAAALERALEPRPPVKPCARRWTRRRAARGRGRAGRVRPRPHVGSA
jgi:hypothetical protein